MGRNSASQLRLAQYVPTRLVGKVYVEHEQVRMRRRGRVDGVARPSRM
jgi:hypothetical protein